MTHPKYSLLIFHPCHPLQEVTYRLRCPHNVLLLLAFQTSPMEEICTAVTKNRIGLKLPYMWTNQIVFVIVSKPHPQDQRQKIADVAEMIKFSGSK